MSETITGIVFAAPIIGCLPLLLTILGIVKRAELYERNPGWYLLIAVVGWFVGLSVCAVGATAILIESKMLRTALDPTHFVGVLATALAGAIVGGGSGYVLLWMRTVCDPDYDDRY